MGEREKTDKDAAQKLKEIETDQAATAKQKVALQETILSIAKEEKKQVEAAQSKTATAAKSAQENLQKADEALKKANCSKNASEIAKAKLHKSEAEAESKLRSEQNLEVEKLLKEMQAGVKKAEQNQKESKVAAERSMARAASVAGLA